MKALLVILASFSLILGRPIRSPKEVYEFMDSSKLVYRVEKLDSAVEFSGEALTLPPNLVISDSGLTEIPLKAEALEMCKKADAAFQNYASAEAYDLYMKTYELDPSYSPALTYAANCLFSQEKFAEAGKLLKRSIDQNFYSYQAHWFLADCYFAQGDTKRAFDHLVTAHILNRNKDLIFSTLAAAAGKFEKGWEMWSFEPQYRISKTDDTVSVKISDEWIGWAFSSAAWQYEPEYTRDYDQKDGLTACKEALLGYLSASHGKSDLCAKQTQRAVEDGYLYEFLLYEYLMRRDPSIPYQLDRKMIERIKSYIVTYHFK